MLNYDVATRFLGQKEIAGAVHNAQIMSMLKLDYDWPDGDEVPWCSAFVNYVHYVAGMRRSKSLKARSWLKIGTEIALNRAKIGDIVILNRGNGSFNPSDYKGPGHVGFFTCFVDDEVIVLGGNQSNSVNHKYYPKSKILGIRRVHGDR